MTTPIIPPKSPRPSRRCARRGRRAAWCWHFSRIATRARAICWTISAASLSECDVLLVTEVYAAGEAPIAGADGRAICRAVRTRGLIEPVFVERVDDLAESLRGRAARRRCRADHGRRATSVPIAQELKSRFAAGAAA